MNYSAFHWAEKARKYAETVGTIFNVKGRVDTVQDLPATGNKVGDLYLVGLSTDSDLIEYAWLSFDNVTRWEKLGSTTASLAFSAITGSPNDNTALKNALDGKYSTSNPNGYQANILEGVQVNGTDLTITNKKVNVLVPTQASDIGAQPTLVSGTNIKTINGNSILGSGNISTGDSTKANTSLDNLDSTGQAVIDGKVDLNLNNMNASQTAKETIVGWGMPDFSSGISKSLNTIYQAESDGWISIRGQGNGSTATFVLNYSANNDMSNPTEVVGDYFNCSNNEKKLLPIPKDMFYQATQTISYFSMIFYPVKGAQNA